MAEQPIQRPRDTWFVTNVSNNSIRITDVPSIPVIKPGKRIDLLVYTSFAVVSGSTVLTSYISNGSIVVEEYLHTHDDKAESVHEHVLTDVTDVTSTSDEINQALDGIGSTVTDINLTTLTDGSNADDLHIHEGTGGVSIHNELDGLNDGDFIHLTSAEKTEFAKLTDGSNADDLHTHTLDAITDITATASEINQALDGIGTNVTSSNLDVLVNGGNANGLHNHGASETPDHDDLNGLNAGEFQHLTSAEKIDFNSNTADRHDELHTIASHTDTSATGSELNTLTNGPASNADSLHTHTAISHPNHNDLSGLNDGDFKHLTSANHTTLTDDVNADSLHFHNADNIPLGEACDSDWTDGLFDWNNNTLTACALDEVSETMSFLAPADASSMDGQTMTTSGVSIYTGRLSDGNVNYPGGFGIGSTYTRIINDGTFSILSPNQSTMFNKADEGTLIYYINGVQNDTYDLASAFSEAERAGSQTYPPVTGVAGNLRIDSVGYYNGFPKWQIGNATMIVVPGDLRQGYNFFNLKHDLSTDQDANTLEFFYDNDAGSNPSITGTPVVTQNTKVSKWLSGIEHYYRASTFDLDTVGDDCFDNVYHQTSPLTYASTSSTMGSGNIDFNDSSVSGMTGSGGFPLIGNTMTVTNKVITTPNSDVRSTNSRATVTPRDPYGNYSSASSISENRLVDAYLFTSSDLIENFDDEDYRLPDNDGSAYPGNYDSVPSPITGVWTSATALSNGEAQVYDGGLYRPTINFTSGYLPTQFGTNYSTFSGDQVYVRAFYDLNDPHSSGQLELQGLVNADVGPVGSGAVNVEIRLPGVLPTATEWLDLGSTYFSGSFTGSYGDGCRSAQVGNLWSWTVGTFSTSFSGWMIMVRVTFRNSTKNITRIRQLGW